MPRLDAVYEPSLTGYQPLVSIIANRILTHDRALGPAATPDAAQLNLHQLQTTGQ